MKKFLVLFLMLVSAQAFAGFIETGANGQAVSDGNPLAVKVIGGVPVALGSSTINADPVWADAGGSGTLGLVDASRRPVVVQGPYTTVLSTNTTSTTVSAQVASLAARLVVRIVNQSATETVWIAENSTVATVSFGLPLLPQQAYEEILGPGVPVSYISATTCKINIFQAK